MRRLAIGLICILTMVLGAAGSGDSITIAPAEVPVLLYHHLEPGAGDENGAIVSVAEFATQVAWLKENGYTGISTAQLAAWLTGEGRLPRHPVLITFDDGYRSNYEHAFPILTRYHMRAAIFLVTGNIGPDATGRPKLTWEQILTMERSGLVKFQAHTHDGHRQIADRPALLSWSPAELQRDTEQSRASFAEHGIKQPTAFAYPFGAADEQVRLTLARQGFATAFTVEHGAVRPGDGSMALKRMVIYPGTPMCRFAEMVSGAPVCVNGRMYFAKDGQPHYADFGGTGRLVRLGR